MQWLDEQFILQLAPQLQGFKRLRTGVFNFRCPICGDSEKDKTKRRGYFYLSKGKYRTKCHNCSAGGSFYDFLENFDAQLFTEYKRALFKERRSTVNKPFTKTPTAPPKPKRRQQTVSGAGLFGFDPVSKLDAVHPAVEYLVERKVPKRAWSSIYFVEEMSEIAQKLEGYENTKFDNNPRIIFPFITEEHVLTHVQGRAINRVDKSKRYVTLEVIPDVPKVFGMNRVKLDEDIIVVEGPIDSLFIKNSIAMGGADLDTTKLNKDNTIFVFDNEPRNREIVKRMEKVVNFGFRVCIWGPEISSNDINDMVLDGWSPLNLKDYIISHTFKGLRAKNELSRYSKW